jgi:hypothetical protein
MSMIYADARVHHSHIHPHLLVSQIIKRKMPIKFSPEKISRLYIQESGDEERIKKVEAASLGIKTGTKIYAIWKHTKTHMLTDCEVEVTVTPEFLELKNDVCTLKLQVCELRYQRVPGVIHKAGTYKSYFLNATTLIDAKGDEIGWKHVPVVVDTVVPTSEDVDVPVSEGNEDVQHHPPPQEETTPATKKQKAEDGSRDKPIDLSNDEEDSDSEDSEDSEEDTYVDPTKKWRKDVHDYLVEANETSANKIPFPPGCL